MLHPRFAFPAAALALVLGCSDDAAVAPSGGPAFEGVSYVVPDKDGNLVVSWKPADGAVDYRVYVSKIQGRELKTQPAVRSNSTSALLKPDVPGATYYVMVRAANVANLEDNNQVEKSAIATPDTKPPTFGAPKALPDGNAGVKLTWDPAQDDFTPPEAIVYEVYAARSKTNLVKVATTLPGDTSISFSQLGNPGEQFDFAVRARDVAGNVSAEAAPVSTALGPDATPPTFDGCDTVVAQGSRTVTVTWKPGSDNATPASALSYEVYASKEAGKQDLNAPLAKVTGGGTATTLTNLDPASTYYVLCRARDGANNLDVNKNEKTVQTGSDVTPPTFAGITKEQFDEKNRSVTLEWAPATDDQTAPAAIIYDVFESKVTGSYDFNAPKASSTPGATSISLTNLASRSTLYWVVRARDAAGNRDTNLVEKSGTTKVSFAIDVQGVFDRNCAVIGCHVTGPATGGLNLVPGFSYKSLVDAPSTEKRAPNAMVRVASTGETKDSWLWLKITEPDVGALMPAPQTGNTLTSEDKNIIRDWIEGGALAN